VIAGFCSPLLPFDMQEIQISGMALFGWLMAALMILSPAIALIRLIRQRVTSGRPHREN
jgi:hypothetical protein